MDSRGRHGGRPLRVSGLEPAASVRRSELRSQSHSPVQQRSSPCSRRAPCRRGARAFGSPVAAGAAQSHRGSLHSRHRLGRAARHDGRDLVCAGADGYGARNRRPGRRPRSGRPASVSCLEARARAGHGRSCRHGRVPDCHGLERHADPGERRVHDVPSDLGQRFADAAGMESCAGHCAHARRVPRCSLHPDQAARDRRPRRCECEEPRRQPSRSALAGPGNCRLARHDGHGGGRDHRLHRPGCSDLRAAMRRPQPEGYPHIRSPDRSGHTLVDGRSRAARGRRLRRDGADRRGHGAARRTAASVSPSAPQIPSSLPSLPAARVGTADCPARSPARRSPAACPGHDRAGARRRTRVPMAGTWRPVRSSTLSFRFAHLASLPLRQPAPCWPRPVRSSSG